MNDKIVLAQLADDEQKQRNNNGRNRQFETHTTWGIEEPERPPQGVEEPKHHRTQVVGSGGINQEHHHG